MFSLELYRRTFKFRWIASILTISWNKKVRILIKFNFRPAVGHIIQWNEVEFMLFTTIFLNLALNYNSLFNMVPNVFFNTHLVLTIINNYIFKISKIRRIKLALWNQCTGKIFNFYIYWIFDDQKMDKKLNLDKLKWQKLLKLLNILPLPLNIYIPEKAKINC